MLQKAKLSTANEFSLAGFEILRDVPRDVVHALARQCQFRLYRANQTVLQYCDDSRDVFFVISGKVCAIYHSLQGRDIRFGDLRIGEIFGELAAIDGQPRSADIVALSDSVLAMMPEFVFKDAIDTCRPFAAAIMRRLAAKVRAISERVTELSTLSVRSRVHAELLRLSRTGRLDRNSVIISPRPTHADLASRISTQREAVTRELNHLARAGLVQRQGANLVVRDLGALVKMLSNESGFNSAQHAQHFHYSLSI
jgi:CRP/FNR family transcriptional regulator, cyclic AMP receptor protein